MKPNQKSTRDNDPYKERIKCIIYFCILFLLLFFTTILIASHTLIFQIMVLGTGWFSWSFVEYFAHRFWIHSLTTAFKTETPVRAISLSHPANKTITHAEKLILLSIMAVLVVISLILVNYFTLIAGFFSGFISYCFIPVFADSRWFAKLFPALKQ